MIDNQKKFDSLFFDVKFQGFIKCILESFKNEDLTINLFSINYTKQDIESFKIYFGFNKYIDGFLLKHKDSNKAWDKLHSIYSKYRDVINIKNSRGLCLAFKKYKTFDSFYTHYRLSTPNYFSFGSGEEQIENGVSYEIDSESGDVIEEKRYFYLKSPTSKMLLSEKFKDAKIMDSYIIEYMQDFKGEEMISEKYNFINKFDCRDVTTQSFRNDFRDYVFMIQFNEWLKNRFDIICRTFGIYEKKDEIALYYYPSDYHVGYPKYIDVLSKIFEGYENRN